MKTDTCYGRQAAVALAFTCLFTCAFADDTAQQIAQLQAQQQLLQMQLQILQTQSSILSQQRALGGDAQRTADATQQAALLNALVTLQTAQSNLAKGDVDAAAAMANAQKSLQEAQNQLAAAQLKSDFVTADVLKQYFSAAQGKDGNITIKEGGARLLQTAVMSARAADQLAERLCKKLQAAGIKEAVVVDIGKLALIQEATLVEGSFGETQNRLEEAQSRVQDLLGEEGGKAFAIESLSPLGALAAIPYVAGGIQAITKLFRTDRDMAVSSDATRADLFATFLGTKPACAGVIGNPVPDYLALNVKDRLETLRDAYQNLVVANASASETSLRADAEIKKLEDAAKPKDSKAKDNKEKEKKDKEKKGAETKNEAASAEAAQRLTDLRAAQLLLKANLDAAKGFLDSVKPGADNKLMVYASLLTIGDRIEGKPRLIFAFVSQDVQDTRSSVWSSARTGRLGTAQVSYRVLKPDNSALAAGGFLSYSTAEGDLKTDEPDEAAYPEAK